MSKIKPILLVFALFFLTVSVNAVEFLDVGKPGIKKKAIAIEIRENRGATRLYGETLSSLLDQSLLIQMTEDRANADLLLTLGGSVDDEQVIVQLSGVQQSNFETISFGIGFRSEGDRYILLRAAQTSNVILKQLFGIAGSFGSEITWSNVENNRKVIYRAAFGLPDTTEKISLSLASRE